MKIKFIGNQLNPEDYKGYYIRAGERFDLNVPRDLPEGKAFEKLPRNGHFALVEDDWDFDPNADKTQDPPEPDEKAELIAFAEEHGVKIDKRWNVAKITAAIEAAAASKESE